MRENKHLEFKSKLTDTFLKTVTAYANYDGGKILFGVDDQGNTIGVSDAKSLALRIENKINDKITPAPDFLITTTNSGRVVCLEVRAGINKPYFLNNKTYKRNDTSTVEVDKTELKRLILEGDNIDFEELRSKDQDLTFKTLTRELKDKIGISKLDRDILKTLSLYKDSEGYNNAADILSDNNSFPGIDVVKFGENINIFKKRATLDRRSILDSYNKAVEIYKDFYQYEIVDGIDRHKVESIPEEAVREALANAIIHRVWDVDAHINVSMFDDRIEIVSLGGLPDSISEDSYLNGNLSILRNPILAGVFHRLGLIERFGTGIRRIRQAYAASRNKPQFLITEDSIRVTLPVLSGIDDLTEDERHIYDHLSRNISKPINEVMSSKDIRFGKTKVTNLLKDMSDRGIVVVEGNGRGTRYRINANA
ncbi:MAG: putative DNA binding domain-containing protein [Clostridiales bacterium]|nr:putative DNA binding domain-containing protein [Clostridiales bacterium]